MENGRFPGDESNSFMLAHGATWLPETTISTLNANHSILRYCMEKRHWLGINKGHKENICVIKYPFRSYLKREDEKQYNCGICGKGFRWSSSLKRHAITHVGNRPLKCEVCFKEFIWRSTLKNHMLIHTGNRK